MVSKPAGKSKRTCPNGHQYLKSSDCPVCEAERNPAAGFLSVQGAPARRALENAGVTILEKLSAYSEAELLRLHGFGPSSLPKLRAELALSGLSFKRD